MNGAFTFKFLFGSSVSVIVNNTYHASFQMSTDDTI